ncbi:CDP-glycerol glycerophosphotransferase family protein, partial [Enterococcus saccharolyticus]|uniref:CDP-glycerol glycerophosphotransferase family protein n=1 Tax=Enterococcus saccharolyticus TaxID=41997 RepID=UPI001E2EF832
YSINRLDILISKIIPLLKGSKIIFADNYFAFLGEINFDSETEIVQLWHANGAIKTFGLEAQYTKLASKIDINRYKKVYSKFTKYVVSSKKMADIFEKNYQTKISILPFGYIPTDNYFDKSWIEEVKLKFKQKISNSKKILLYVPTYREGKSNLQIDLSRISKELGDEWIFLVKAHPHDKTFQDKIRNEKRIVSDFQKMSIQELLPSVDCLITDYSSIPFEYTLANPMGKIIFFCHDFEYYQETVGIEPDFFEWAPGPILTEEKQLIQEIKLMSSSNFEQFNQLWNEYATGNSCQQLIEWVEDQYENRKNHGDSNRQYNL